MDHWMITDCLNAFLSVPCRLEKYCQKSRSKQGGIRQIFAEGMPKICFGHHLVPTCKFFPTSHIFSSNFLGPTKFFPKMQIFSTENLGPTNFFPKMQIFSIEKLGPTYIPTLKNHRNSADGCRLQYQSFRGINTIKFSVSYWIRDNFMLFLVIDCVFLSQCGNQRENAPQHYFSLSQQITGRFILKSSSSLLREGLYKVSIMWLVSEHGVLKLKVGPHC